jgi:hypothetical protein
LRHGRLDLLYLPRVQLAARAVLMSVPVPSLPEWQPLGLAD